MMQRPSVLDLGCGAGAVSLGLWRAGFRPFGLDIVPQPRYPFPFILGDALTYPLEGYDAYHASMPCQLWAQATLGQRRAGKEYPDLVTPVRERLLAQDKPWTMENVPGSPLRPDIELCGCMFGLKISGLGYLNRLRVAETSWGAREPRPAHNHEGYAISICGHGTPSWQRRVTGHVGVALWREIMGIDWMNRDELTEAVPPDYGFYLGQRLMAQVQASCRIPSNTGS
jgi:DNA (cytosine-5)-methyltransferase 1